MKLDEVRLQNFRAYKGECSVPIARLTALVGRNDVGKSTILDALGIFFGHEQCTIEPGDRCVHAANEADVAITCVFSEIPNELVLDDSAKTSLADERLLNPDGKLEIRKIYRGEKLKEETVVVAQHPSTAPAHELLLAKNSELKKIARELGVTADHRSNVDLRRSIREAVGELASVRTEIPVSKEGAKEIWSTLERALPLFALFRADRASTDEDGEVQDPMRLAVKQALKDAEKELVAVQELVSKRALEVATETLGKLAELDDKLASTLTPRFRAEPKWDGIFKLSLTGDHDIPINKRGSGVRRLVLLGFFQAEVERRRKSNEKASSVIYAIEEPETSQHPANQIAVIEALKALSETPGCQVVLTTHVPALAGLVPAQSIQLVTQNDSRLRAINAGDGILKAVADELGVLPDLHDARVKVFLCVEGPTDIEFFASIARVVREVNPKLVELGVDPRVAMVPLGGRGRSRVPERHAQHAADGADRAR